MRWLRIRNRQNKRGDRQLDAIRIFTGLLELDGYVAPTGQRVTDILLRGQDLAFLPAGADSAPENWIYVSPSDLQVVIPPPLRSRPDRLEATALIGVFVQVGAYEVTGAAHVRKGELLDEKFRRRHPFLPLTRAQIVRAGNVSRVEVAIVNLGASSRFGPAP
jgi:hypothetical protein